MPKAGKNDAGRSGFLDNPKTTAINRAKRALAMARQARVAANQQIILDGLVGEELATFENVSDAEPGDVVRRASHDAPAFEADVAGGDRREP